MGCIDAGLTRYIAHHAELAPVPHITITAPPIPRSAKLAELDGLIEALHGELDATPNRRWQDEGTQYRLTLLISYTQKRHLLSL